MLAAAAALAAGGCERDSGAAEGARPAARSPERAPEAAPPRAMAPRAYPAVRCAECHEKMFEEWKGSAHATASSSPLYRSMQSQAGDETCQGCHAPLAAHLPPGDLAAAEGVTCEVCHNIKEVAVTPAGAGFELMLDDKVKYGPLCDAKDHYFHRMGCSPLHEEATFCAGCHLHERELPGGGTLPVFTEYEEWRTGPHGEAGMDCQQCHMPGERAEVAAGAGERAGVSHHGLLAVSGDLRARALEARAAVRAAGDRIAVEVAVKNVGAGHFVPTGLPGRRIVVRAAVVSASGEELASAEHRFGRILVDDAGAEVPFYRATRVAADERIPPRKSRTGRIELDPAGGAELRLEIRWRPLDPAIARSMQIEPDPDEVLLRGTVPLKAGPGARVRPRTVVLSR